MNVLLPDPKSLNRNHPVNLRDRLLVIRDTIAGDKLAWAQDKHDRVAPLVAEDGPIKPREVTHAGNISMYEHLSNMRDRLANDPEGEADKEIANRDARLAKLDEEILPNVRWPEDD